MTLSPLPKGLLLNMQCCSKSYNLYRKSCAPVCVMNRGSLPKTNTLKDHKTL